MYTYIYIYTHLYTFIDMYIYIYIVDVCTIVMLFPLPAPPLRSPAAPAQDGLAFEFGEEVKGVRPLNAFAEEAKIP